MEKKTFGNFLAILRKAKGMTQKELAELVNVSDKAVSRWERDESMPDILLIPVLADIFEVSCDDLLRGERTVKESCQETTEKRIQRTITLIKKSKSKFQAFCMIPIGVALVGFIVSVVLNFSFNRATIGFYSVLTGILLGAVSLAAFYIYFSNDVDTEGLINPEFANYKKYIRDHTLHISYLLGILLCICLPLALFGQISYADYIANINAKMAPAGFEPAEISSDAVFPMGTIAVGLQLKTWILYGGIGALVGGICSVIITFMIKLQDAKKGRFNISDDDIKKSKKNILSILKYFLVLVILLSVTFAGAKVFKEKMPKVLEEGRTFHTFEEFKEHMETIPEDMYWGVVELRQQLDKYKGIIYGDDGEVLCEYRIFNDSVTNIEFGENNKLPITVYSEDDILIAKQNVEDLMWIWTVAMFLEFFAVTIVYFKRKNKV